MGNVDRMEQLVPKVSVSVVDCTSLCFGATQATTCSTCSTDIVLYIYCRNYTLNHVLVLQVHISHQPAV